jgi:hypothetical protein
MVPRNPLIIIYRSRDPFANSGKLSQHLANQSPSRISLLEIVVNVLFRSVLSQYRFHYSPFQLLAYILSELVVLYIVRLNYAHYAYERMPTLI